MSYRQLSVQVALYNV